MRHETRLWLALSQECTFGLCSSSPRITLILVIPELVDLCWMQSIVTLNVDAGYFETSYVRYLLRLFYSYLRGVPSPLLN